MKKLFCILLLCCLPAQAELVYECQSRSEASLVVYIDKDSGDCDTVVYLTKSKSEAAEKAEVWCVVNTKAEATRLVYITDDITEADLVVCFTPFRSAARSR